MVLETALWEKIWRVMGFRGSIVVFIFRKNLCVEFYLKPPNYFILCFWLCCAASGILVPRPEREAMPWHWKCQVLTTAKSLSVRLFVIIWTAPRQAPLSMGFSRQEYWSGLPCLPPGDLPDLGIETVSPVAPVLQAGSLLLSHWGSPLTTR